MLCRWIFFPMLPTVFDTVFCVNAIVGSCDLGRGPESYIFPILHIRREQFWRLVARKGSPALRYESRVVHTQHMRRGKFMSVHFYVSKSSLKNPQTRWRLAWDTVLHCAAIRRSIVWFKSVHSQDTVEGGRREELSKYSKPQNEDEDRRIWMEILTTRRWTSDAIVDHGSRIRWVKTLMLDLNSNDSHRN